jgi:hypothetical protein
MQLPRTVPRTVPLSGARFSADTPMCGERREPGCALFLQRPLKFAASLMEVFALTIFVSLAFAVLFAVLFFAERSQRHRRSIEQTSLLPLDDSDLS